MLTHFYRFITNLTQTSVAFISSTLNFTPEHKQLIPIKIRNRTPNHQQQSYLKNRYK